MADTERSGFRGPADADSKGGKAAAASMTKKQRRERALKAVRARKWHPVVEGKAA